MTPFISRTHSYQPHLTPTAERLRGKVALITGGARGIGQAIALRYAQEGADVAIVDKDPLPGEETAHAVRGLGVNATVFPADVANRKAVEIVVRDVLKCFGRVDILVNNAGMIVFGSLMECRQEDWDRMLAVDL